MVLISGMNEDPPPGGFRSKSSFSTLGRGDDASGADNRAQQCTLEPPRMPPTTAPTAPAVPTVRPSRAAVAELSGVYSRTSISCPTGTTPRWLEFTRAGSFVIVSVEPDVPTRPFGPVAGGLSYVFCAQPMQLAITSAAAAVLIGFLYTSALSIARCVPVTTIARELRRRVKCPN